MAYAPLFFWDCHCGCFLLVAVKISDKLASNHACVAMAFFRIGVPLLCCGSRSNSCSRSDLLELNFSPVLLWSYALWSLMGAAYL